MIQSGTMNEDVAAKRELIDWFNNMQAINTQRFSGNLYSESEDSPLKLDGVAAEYATNAEEVDGRVVLRDNFDMIFEKYPETLIFVDV